MTSQDPYKWAKCRIKHLLNEIRPLEGNQGPVSPGDTWSVKKILVLDYYLGASQLIFRKYFDEWYYVDTHCGSGMFKVSQANSHNDVLFPGSPLIALLRPDDKRYTKHLLSDSDITAVDALRRRLSKLGVPAGNLCETAVRDFSETSKLVKSMKKRGRAFVVNVDPAGFKHLAWSDLERILSVDKADVFVTLMIYALGMGRPQAQDVDGEMAVTFDRVFGSDEWRKCKNNDDLTSLYMQQIKTKKRYVERLPVFATRGGAMYQLIFASNNASGAGRIIDYTKKIADKVSTEMIADAMGVATNKSQDLDKYMGASGEGAA